MKKSLFIIISLAISAWGCTGDCLTCHPALVPTIKEDSRHRPMLQCIECHRPDAEIMAECGSDCFACHPVETIEKIDIEAHRVIRGCRDCHLKLEEERLRLLSPSGQSLRSILVK